MNKSLIRVVLCSTATYLVPAIPAALLLPTTAAAQVACSQTGPAITCLNAATTVATGTTDGTVTAGPGLVINSAGNSGVLDATLPNSALISVAATGSTDIKASWSSFGDYVDVSAPGTRIWTTTRGGGYAAVSGTSFSSPISTRTSSSSAW